MQSFWSAMCAGLQAALRPRQEENRFSPASGKTRLGMDILRISDCGKAVKNVGEAVDCFIVHCF
ncbi:hypothetical protein SynRS9915_01537 [Synechococcus sp. RS9915]|nr:hypothetical protein SynRS9915_01537 [Synechococcus sp. RS9915]